MSGLKKGEQIRSSQDHSIFVGISTPTNRIDQTDEDRVENAAGDDAAKRNKKGQTEAGGENHPNKALWGIKDGLLLVVTTRINGHSVRALIDSGATRCFVTPACITAIGLKGVARDIFLELGNGQNYLSRGYVPEVPVVTAGLTVKVGLTVTNLLHDVDVILGVNWLELVNPVIDWSNGKIYLPNAVHTALLQGEWLQNQIRAGTVTVLMGQEDLKQMAEARDHRSITVLKQPKFWKSTRSTYNSRPNLFEGDVQWGFLHGNNCKICNFERNCNMECKHMKHCKLFVIKGDEGKEILRVKRTNVNARLPVRGTEGAAGYDLAAAEATVVPAHGKCLVKTGLRIALPSGCYGRIAPRSGLTIKKFIDVGAGVVDTDYRGEVGVVLFNFSDSDFMVNMGDRVAQLILEKIKTPVVKELDSLGGTDRGDKGFGSTGISVANEREVVSNERIEDTQMKTVTIATPTSNTRQWISARQLQKLAKVDSPVYLAIVRKTDEVVRTRQRTKRTSSHVAQFAVAHGRKEINKRSVNKQKGPKKDIISVAQREQQVLDSVPVHHRRKLEKIIQEYRDVFPEQLPKGIPPARVVEHSIQIEPGSKPSYRPPYQLGPAK